MEAMRLYVSSLLITMQMLHDNSIYSLTHTLLPIPYIVFHSFTTAPSPCTYITETKDGENVKHQKGSIIHCKKVASIFAIYLISSTEIK